MSSRKTPAKPKVVKVLPEPAPVAAEAKPKRTRAPKPKPTKEEILKVLSDGSRELEQIIQELKEDEMKLPGMQFKRIPELVKETIKNLEEDKEDIDEEYKEVMASEQPLQ
ncbi:MAG TPA: hypothetical protein PLS50_08195 [Candidatus Dojkabacteria bacterium]|nr:hypothetical protein [Candidatus Dojkabacteria bacterium]